jgi:hypothetical protein
VAEPSKSTAPAADPPEVAALQFKRDELKEKLKRLEGFKQSTEHDIEGSKQRTKNLISEIESELKKAAK